MLCDEYIAFDIIEIDIYIYEYYKNETDIYRYVKSIEILTCLFL